MLVTEINPNDELWLSKVEAPQIITDANLFAWDDEADLSCGWLRWCRYCSC